MAKGKERGAITELKEYAGFCNILSTESGLGPSECWAEWERRKSLPEQYEQDHGGFKGALRIEIETSNYKKKYERMEESDQTEVAGAKIRKPRTEDIQNLQKVLLSSTTAKALQDTQSPMKFSNVVCDDLAGFEKARQDCAEEFGDLFACEDVQILDAGKVAANSAVASSSSNQTVNG